MLLILLLCIAACGWFADDIDLLGSSEEELQKPTERLDKTAAGYRIEIRSDKQNLRRGHQAKATYQYAHSAVTMLAVLVQRFYESLVITAL